MDYKKHLPACPLAKLDFLLLFSAIFLAASKIFFFSPRFANSVTSLNSTFRFVSIQCAILFYVKDVCFIVSSRRGHTFHKSSAFSPECDAIYPRIPNVHLLRATKEIFIKILDRFLCFSSLFFYRRVCWSFPFA